MTQRQRERIATLLYDAGKIVFAAAVVGKLFAHHRLDMVQFLCGVMTVASLWWLAYDLEGEDA